MYTKAAIAGMVLKDGNSTDERLLRVPWLSTFARDVERAHA
jgi:hypothetical protein